jgi:hypothetical protein
VCRWIEAVPEAKVDERCEYQHIGERHGGEGLYPYSDWAGESVGLAHPWLPSFPG